GVTGGRAKALAELATRGVKEHRPHRELYPEWQKTAEEHGFTRNEASRILKGRAQEMAPKEANKVLDRAINDAVTKLTAQKAHFSRYEIIAEVCNATVDRRIAPDRALARIDETLHEDRFKALGAWKNQERFTTR